jgi:hypothetical protein
MSDSNSGGLFGNSERCKDMRQLLTTLQVSQFLKLSHLQVSPQKSLPLAYVESQPMVAYA